MTRESLIEIRREIEEIADDAGPYVVRCGRTGERPVPVADRRFATRAAAERGVRLTSIYRARLRRYDPRTPFHDPIVCERPEDGPSDRRRDDERTPPIERRR